MDGSVRWFIFFIQRAWFGGRWCLSDCLFPILSRLLHAASAAMWMGRHGKAEIDTTKRNLSGLSLACSVWQKPASAGISATRSSAQSQCCEMLWLTRVYDVFLSASLRCLKKLQKSIKFIERVLERVTAWRGELANCLNVISLFLCRRHTKCDGIEVPGLARALSSIPAEKKPATIRKHKNCRSIN